MSGIQGTMRIGEVHAQLRKDFPDVELSKIRYYEDKGLVCPSRSRKGYRLYSERDVACLREAIRLANEEFVPLRVVRLRLIEQGLLSDSELGASTRSIAREANAATVSVVAPTKPVLTSVPSATEGDVAARPYVSAQELLTLSGLSPEEFNHIQSIGLVTPSVIQGESLYDALDLRIATLAQSLFSLGVDPRVLGSLRRIAQRYVGVVDEATFTLVQGSPTASAAHHAQLVESVAFDITQLGAALLERELMVNFRS